MSLTHSNDVPAPVAHDVGPNDPHGVHAVPRRVLLVVYLILIVLTGVTYGASRVDLGPANIFVALGIAVLKASLVVLYFMHLRWDSPFNAVIFIAALFFVALFIGLALLDSKTYQPSLKPTPVYVAQQ
jgi:cytochrome c oxidase subunit IV